MREAAYWIALSHLRGWGYHKINKLVVQFFHEEKITIEDFFHLPAERWQSKYGLDFAHVADLNDAKANLANNAFLAEDLLSKGFELLPITSPLYSTTLKKNLKAAYAPTLLYIKGNKQLLSEKSIAIVGSRNASPVSLEFTDRIAKMATNQYKVVVSGFAKGVDKQALDSSIKYHGQSIIVLPQGILTFQSGFKTYYKEIVNGDVLALSTFHPRAPWKTELAMARNPIIYGLAEEIFVAESGDKGGTWSGVLDGLKKGRQIFVRTAGINEKNANRILIEKGAIAVDNNGNIINEYSEKLREFTVPPLVEEPVIEDISTRIRNLCNGKPMTAKEIGKELDIDWSSQKLTNYLKKLSFIETFKEKNKNFFRLKSSSQQNTLW